MDWLRRNWPDLAIGVALVAVIAGIVATLITGGSFFPSGPTVQPPAADPPAVVAPAGATPTDPAAAVPDPAPADGELPAPVGVVSVLTPDGAEPTADPPAGGLAAPADAAATPATPAPATTPAVATPPAATPAPSTPAVATPAVATPAPTTPAAAAPSTPAVANPGPLPAASSDEEAPYRVAVGAFGNADNAARLAATFRDAGYPVFTGTQDALTIVLVGPYALEAEATQVAARIEAGDFGVEPVVYRFRPDAPSGAASTPAPAATPTPAAAPAPVAAPAAATPAPATPAATPGPIATSASGRSLQVGAFADASSAAPLRERLASVGLVAFEVREDGLTKLLVGPFDADGLATARARLVELGIESFPR